MAIAVIFTTSYQLIHIYQMFLPVAQFIVEEPLSYRQSVVALTLAIFKQDWSVACHKINLAPSPDHSRDWREPPPSFSWGLAGSDYS